MINREVKTIYVVRVKRRANVPLVKLEKKEKDKKSFLFEEKEDCNPVPAWSFLNEVN